MSYLTQGLSRATNGALEVSGLVAAGISLDSTIGSRVINANASSVTLTTDHAVAAGGRILLFVYFDNTAATVTVSGGGLTWTTDIQGSVGNLNQAICSAPAPAGLATSTVLTATFSASGTGFTICAASFLGLAAGVEDTQLSNAGTSTWAVGAMTNVTADALVVGFGTDYQDGTDGAHNTPATNYTELFDFGANNPITSAVVYRIVSALGSYTPGGTFAGARIGAQCQGAIYGKA